MNGERLLCEVCVSGIKEIRNEEFLVAWCKEGNSEDNETVAVWVVYSYKR